MNDTSTDVQAPRAARPTSVVQIIAGVVLAAIVACLLNVAVAALAHAAGAHDTFRPLHAATFVPFTVVGVLIATAGWSAVRRSRHAVSTLRWLVPAALVVSWVPDLLVGAGSMQPGTTWTGVIGLMAMHLVVAAIAVGVLLRVLPVHDR